MNTERPTELHDERVHRALASPVRRRIVELLSEEPADAHALADRLDLHVNTARTHLFLLEEASLVASEPEPRDRPGRPRLRYRVTEPRHDDGAKGYRFLAEVLASHLAASVDDPATKAEQAGVAWGRFLVETPAPFQQIDPQAAIARVVELLDEFGFKPELDNTDAAAPRLLLRRCPFLLVAKQHQDVVCSVHLGIMRGALDELGVDVEARDLLPFVEPDLCVSNLQVPA